MATPLARRRACSARERLRPCLRRRPARAQVSSLEGEIFTGLDVEVGAVCDPFGTSTITFRAEGIALGPYSGTFVEEGTFTTLGIGGGVLSFDASFTIFALTGEVVTGRKTLTRGLFTISTAPFGVDASALVSYEATIRTASGSFRDTGEAQAGVDGFGCDPSCTMSELFDEEFLLSTGPLPVSTTGKATGGGQFLDATTQERVTFGFEVKSTKDPNRLQGRCLVLDRARETQVKCLDARNYEEFANTATWEGTAEVNGVREDYKITVQDNGEPNQGLDTFAIDTESYDAAGPVERGNVQIHKQQGAL